MRRKTCDSTPNASAWVRAMFANISLTVMNFAFPDICKVPTPLGPVPVPLPNIVISVTHIPCVFNIIIGGGLAENLLTQGTVSNGDEAGLAMGVVSSTIVGPDRYLLGSFRVFNGGLPATRLTSLTIQNTMNAPGVSLVPGQFVNLVLG